MKPTYRTELYFANQHKAIVFQNPLNTSILFDTKQSLVSLVNSSEFLPLDIYDRMRFSGKSGFLFTVTQNSLNSYKTVLCIFLHLW